MSDWPMRSLGRTGRRVTALGLGGAFVHARSHEQGVATVRRALELGVRYFDTSPGYGEGQSQPIFGEALAGRSEDIFLATKLGYLSDRASHRSAAAIARQLEENQRLLRRDRVDLLQIHEADLSCWWTDAPAEYRWARIEAERQYDFAGAPVMDVLREAKRRGQCEHIGITGNTVEPMTRLVRALPVDAALLAFNYDLLHREARAEAIPAVRAKGAAVLVAGVLQCGQLAEAHREWLTEPPKWMTPGIRERYGRLLAIQSECGLSLTEMTIRYLLADESISVILIGASEPGEIERSVAAALAGPLPRDLHEAVEGIGE